MKFERKYAPQSVSEFVFPSKIMASKIQMYLDNDMDGHLLLYGNYGAGKTTLANLLPLEMAKRIDPSIKDVWYETKAGNEVNASSISTIKKSVGLVHPILPRQFIIIDEADTMTAAAMQGMKKLIDDTEAYCSYVFCTNHIEKMDKGLKSRCVALPFVTSDPVAMAKRAKSILRLEKQKLTAKQIDAVVEQSKGDYREMLQLLEQICFQMARPKAA